MKKHILLLLLGITITLNAQQLKVPTIIQEETEWCWVAVSKCVLDYYGHSKQQCEIAEYTRDVSTWHNYGTTPCCNDASQGCNYENYDCEHIGSIQDILVHFGGIDNNCTGFLPIVDIRNNISQRRPLIVRHDNFGEHFIVVYGIDNNDIIYYMDPIDGYGIGAAHYENFKNGILGVWLGTNVLLVSAPFPPHCDNCLLDPGEEEIDCGGEDCPPCEVAPDYKYITTATSDLPSKVHAIQKITAGNAAVKVLSGQDVSFATLGTIELLPGFEVEAGANFNAQIKNSMYEITRYCGKSCFVSYDIPCYYVRYQDHFYLDDVVKIDKIYYQIWRKVYGTDGIYKRIHTETVYVHRDGRVYLWNLITGEESAYLKPGWHQHYIDAIFYGCDGRVMPYIRYWFVVETLKGKSSDTDPEPEESESSVLFSPSDIEDTAPPYEHPTPYFSIIPNPNPGTFQLETNFPLSDIGNLKITNVLGITVYESQNVSSNTIQLQNFAAGLHFVVIILKDGTVLTQKMVMQ